MNNLTTDSRSCVFRFMIMGIALFLLSGCAATQTLISKRNLDVQTKMSDTIFLDPVSPEKKVMYVEVRNTSDKDNFDLENPIKDAMTKRGYRVTLNPDEAYYRLQANVLQVSKTDPTAAAAALQGGYGGPIALGAVAGAGIGAAAGGYKGAAIGGVAGGALGGVTEFVSGNFVKDVVFMIVTDIQLVEKAADGVIVRQDSQQNLKQGMGGTQQQTTSEVTKFKKYRTRVVSTANKANLEYEEAAPILTQGLTRALSGLF
ncbi:complement resistance protein TraT [Petrachloros mirabilis]